MKKYFYLLALVCTLGFFASCSSDDDDEKNEANRLEAIEGTWNVEESTVSADGAYSGSVKVNWEVPAGTTINIDLGGQSMPMDMNTRVIPLINSMSNMYFPQVLKNVTFTADGKISAVYNDADTDAEAEWKTADGYATYDVVSDNLINLHINVAKATENIDDASTKAMVTTILSHQQFSSIPVHISWNDGKPFFYVDKEFVQPLLTMVVGIISQVPTTGMAPEDVASFEMLKGIINQMPEIMNKTTKFEAGIELTK